MSIEAAAKPASLEAKSPFEMRVKLGDGVSETDVKSALRTGDMGFLHSFTTGSAVDGPGIRLVAWTTSCNFRCQFCHNPDTWTLSNGIPVALEQATDEIRKYANGLKRMGGGFTLSGGEPLMQHRFAARLFGAAKQMGLHNAIETNGVYGEKLSDRELQDIDLIILDMKGFSEEQHERVTGGMTNQAVLQFAHRLASLQRPMWIRYVLVPGLTDVETEIAQLAVFAASLGVVERVQVLPFHQLGAYKWERLGLDYRLAQTEPPTSVQVEDAAAIFRSAGLLAA
ncbi:MAG: pyruvate formate-lyase-activating protein [Sphingomicrobium sp.]